METQVTSKKKFSLHDLGIPKKSLSTRVKKVKPFTFPTSGYELYSIDKRRFFRLVTIFAAVQCVQCVVIAEGLYSVVLENSSFRLPLATMALLAGPLVVFGMRVYRDSYVQGLHLLPEDRVKISTYNWWSGVNERVVPVTELSLKENSTGDSHYVKVRGDKLFYVINQRGHVTRPDVYSRVIRGEPVVLRN